MSLATPTSALPSTCSGDMYSGDPTPISVTTAVAPAVPTRRAIPRSISLASPGPRKMFGFEIAMHDAGGVHDLERAEDRERRRCDLRDRHPLRGLAEPVGERRQLE